jgi:hypothetical protein
MRKLLPLALVLLSGCGGAAATTLPGQPTNPAQTTGTGATVEPPATGQATGAAGVVIPASCAAGFIEYLKAIEPVVAGFDPATDTLGDFFAADDAAGDKGYELLTANDSRATYSCSEVGLEFNYFDSRSPWAAIHEIASANAPGTVGYLQVNERVSAIDIAEMSDYGVATCDDAVARIKKGVADATNSGMATVDDMSVDPGIALLGLYNAYLAQVREELCPRDALGNDEFGFMGAH